MSGIKQQIRQIRRQLDVLNIEAETIVQGPLRPGLFRIEADGTETIIDAGRTLPGTPQMWLPELDAEIEGLDGPIPHD